MTPPEIPPTLSDRDLEFLRGLENWTEKAAQRRPGEPPDAADVADLLKATGIPDGAELAEKDPIPFAPPVSREFVHLDKMKGARFSGPYIREFLLERYVRESPVDELGAKTYDAVFFDVSVTCERISEILARTAGHPHEILGELETRLLRAHPKLPLEAVIAFWHSTAVGEVISFSVGLEFRTGVRERLAEYVQELEKSLPAAAPPAEAHPPKRRSGRPVTRPHREIAQIIHRHDRDPGWKAHLKEICDELDEARVSISSKWKQEPTCADDWRDMFSSKKDRALLVNALHDSLKWEQRHPVATDSH